MHCSVMPSALQCSLETCMVLTNATAPPCTVICNAGNQDGEPLRILTPEETPTSKDIFSLLRISTVQEMCC